MVVYGDLLTFGASLEWLLVELQLDAGFISQPWRLLLFM